MTFREAWNSAYDQASLTNWELNDLTDLAAFIRECKLGRSDVHSILDAGCGRGIRGLLALLLNPDLNSPDVSYVGVDFSPTAVAAATDTAWRWRRLVEPKGELERRGLERAGPLEDTRLHADISFRCDDLKTFLYPRDKSFDLTIDWTCLHEITLREREEYCQLLADASERYLVINAFSKEGSSIDNLGEAVHGVHKYQLTQNDILSLFPEFHLIATHDYRENLAPRLPLTDGVVGAKRAYCLSRI